MGGGEGESIWPHITPRNKKNLFISQYCDKCVIGWNEGKDHHGETFPASTPS